ncbi:MAG: beta strand repeat-containing protein [Candidatus Kapaibacterium sp.]
MKKNLLRLMALGVFAASATAVAEVPTTFNFQGRLTNTKNEPVTSTVDVTFEIFDVPQGGTPLHTEVMSITPDQGYFNVRIGADLTNPIQKAVVDGKKALWYQVTFAGVKQQRVMFDAVPYALGAQVASTADTALFAFQADSANYAVKAGEANPVGPAGGVLSGNYPNPGFNNAKFVEALKGNLTSDMLPEDLRAVPKGPADGDIEGYYPNSLKIKQNAVKTIHLFNGAVSLPKLAKPDFEGTSNMMWWNPNNTSEYKWEYSTIKNIIGPNLDNGAIPVWDENAERFKPSVISADDDGALVAGALTVTGATVTNGITNTGDITNSGNIANAGNVAVGGTLDVTGATTLNNTLAVAGATTTNGITNTGDINNSGAVNTATLTTTEGATIGGDVAVGGTLDVTGATTLNNTLDVTGATTLGSTLDIAGATTVGGTLAVTGATTTNGITNTGNITSSGDITNGGNIANTGNVAIGGTLDVAGATTLDNTLDVAGATTVGGTLAVAGATTTNGITNTGDIRTTNNMIVERNLTVAEKTTTDNLVATTATFGNANYRIGSLDARGLPPGGTIDEAFASKKYVDETLKVTVVDANYIPVSNGDNYENSIIKRADDPAVTDSVFVVGKLGVRDNITALNGSMEVRNADNTNPGQGFKVYNDAVNTGSGSMLAFLGEDATSGKLELFNTYKATAVQTTPNPIVGLGINDEAGPIDGGIISVYDGDGPGDDHVVATMYSNDDNTGSLYIKSILPGPGFNAPVNARPALKVDGSVPSVLMNANVDMISPDKTATFKLNDDGTIITSGTTIFEVEDAGVDITGALHTTGDATFDNDVTLGDDPADDLTVNATSLFNAPVTVDDELTVTGLSKLNGGINVNNNKFTVDGATGNVATAGTLTAAGNATFTGDQTTVGDAATDKFDVYATSKFHAPVAIGILTVDELTVNGLSKLNGGINVNNGKFTVATNGNTAIAGTLGVTGATTLNNKLDVAGATTINNTLGVTDLSRLNGGIDVKGGNFTVTAANGNIFTKGNLDVEGNTRLGNAPATDLLTVDAISTFNGVSTFNADVFTKAHTTIGDAATDNLTVNATSTFKAPVTYTNTAPATFNAPVKINSTLDVTGLSSLDGGINVNDNFTVDPAGNTFTKTNLTVEGNTRLGNAPATDLLTVDAKSTFNGVSTFNADVFTNANTTIGDGVGDLLTVKATSTFEENVTMNKNLTVKGNTTLGDKAADPNADKLDVNAISTFNGNVFTNANTTIGDAPADALTVKATSTFNAPATFNDNVFTNANTTIGDAAADALTVKATSTFEANVTMEEDVNIGDADTDALTVEATSTFNADVFTNANTTIGDAAADALTVNATSLFNAPVTIDNDLTVNGSTILGDDATVDIVTINGDVTLTTGSDLTLDEGNITNTKGDINNVEGDIVNSLGNIINTKGDIINTKGDITNTEGDIINVKGNIENQDGKAILSNSQPIETVPDVPNPDANALEVRKGNVQMGNLAPHQLGYITMYANKIQGRTNNFHLSNISGNEIFDVGTNGATRLAGGNVTVAEDGTTTIKNNLNVTNSGSISVSNGNLSVEAGVSTLKELRVNEEARYTKLKTQVNENIQPTFGDDPEEWMPGNWGASTFKWAWFATTGYVEASLPHGTPWNIPFYSSANNKLVASSPLQVDAEVPTKVIVNGIDLEVGRDLAVTRDAEVGRDLEVTRDATVNQDLTVTRDAEVGQDLKVTRDAEVGQDLTVTRDATITRDATVNGNTTLGTDAADNLTVNATSTFNAPVTTAAGQDLTVGGNLTVTGTTTTNGITNNGNVGTTTLVTTTTAAVGTNLTVNQDLVVGGNTTLGSDNTAGAAGGFALDINGNLKMKVQSPAIRAGETFTAIAPIVPIGGDNVTINNGENGQVVYIFNTILTPITIYFAGGSYTVSGGRVVQLVYINGWRVVRR